MDQETPADPEVRGQPRAPRQPRPQLREGAGDPEPGRGPRAHPLPAEARRAAGRRPVGARHLGRGARRHRRRASGRRSRRAGRTRSCTTSAGPGHELVYHQRILHAWGIDGHNSHTNVCSASARAGYAFWSGLDRPSPDHANARFILLLSSHLETGHYFNPHAQRIIEGKKRGAKVCAIDTRLSNTASMADWWLSPWPGTEAALLLAMCQLIIAERRYDREFLRRWVNWAEYLREEHPDQPQTFETFEALLPTLYAEYTPEFAERESGVPAATIVEVAREAARAGSALATHVWRNAAAGNLGGWQVARALQLLVVLVGAVATPGRHRAVLLQQVDPGAAAHAAAGQGVERAALPAGVPARVLRDELPAAASSSRRGAGALDTYFTRVYNPVWTNPDGFSWIEMLTDEAKVGLHACLTPIWSETAWFADYVLPMGHASERHDLMSQETHAARWIGFRQPVLRVALEREGKRFATTWEAHAAAGLGEVWEEDEFWIELSWRIDPDGALGIRKYFESPYRPGEKLTVDEFYGWMFEHSVPGLPEAAAREGPDAARVHAEARRLPRRGRRLPDARDEPSPPEALEGAAVDPADRRDHARAAPRSASRSTAARTSASRRPRASSSSTRRRSGTGSGRSTRCRPTSGATSTGRSIDRAKGEYAPAADVPAADPDPHALRQREVALRDLPHEPAVAPSRGRRAARRRRPATCSRSTPRSAGSSTRCGSPSRSARASSRAPTTSAAGGSPRTRAASAGRRRWCDLERPGPGQWRMRQLHGDPPVRRATTPTPQRVWWEDAGVHQNLTFPVQPDPVSGQHCWHQKVRVERPGAGRPLRRRLRRHRRRPTRSTARWLAMARPAPGPGQPPPAALAAARLQARPLELPDVAGSDFDF